MSMVKRLLLVFSLGLLITSCAQIEVKSTGPNRLAELTKPIQNIIPKKKPPKPPKPKVESIYPVNAKPVYVGNKVYFYTDCGAMVQAVEPGQVIYSGRTLKAYNYIVLIKTPQNLVDVYTYLGKVFVAKGDYVKKGAIIGEVGVDPIDNVCKLLYETRNTNGDIVNPVF
ncbi:murein hydrolase activator EnvC family protein, partial [Hydrogenobaculum sp.]